MTKIRIIYFISFRIFIFDSIWLNRRANHFYIYSFLIINYLIITKRWRKKRIRRKSEALTATKYFYFNLMSKIKNKKNLRHVVIWFDHKTRPIYKYSQVYSRETNPLRYYSIIFTNWRFRPEKKKRKKKMPCLDISTNVNLDGVDTDSLFSTLTTAVSRIVGKPENVRSLSLSL